MEMTVNDNVEMEVQFYTLANQWREETGHLSSVTQMANHSAYRKIIGMGEAVIPLLLNELVEYPDHWFMALQSISGDNPVPEEYAGRFLKMSEYWLEWGREKGYIQ